MMFRYLLASAAVTFLAWGLAGPADADEPRPIRVLYITGGGWHDYPTQQRLITEGLEQRIHVEFTVDHEGGTATDHQLARHADDNWHEGFDVVFYNMCYSTVEDREYVERLAKVHHDRGVPAVFMHCAIHSYRAATDAWFRLGGIRSHRHEGHRPFTVEPLEPDHPIMRPFPETWRTPQGELYEVAEIYDTATPLAHAYGQDTEQHHVVIWTNQYGAARVFGTTIGHHNETVAHSVYLDLMARGTLWAAGKLGDDGQPEPGYDARAGAADAGALTALVAAASDADAAAAGSCESDECNCDDEWVSLFDGESLDGWRVNENPQSFRVEDGVLIVDGPRGHLFYDGPVADANFKNFELKLDVMTFPQANSGVYFHTRFQDSGWPSYGHEAQVNATHHDRVKTGSVYSVQNVMDEAPHKDNEWFNYHIIVQGRQVTIKVDGETVNEYTEAEDVSGPRRLSSGTIALQAHDPDSRIHYKNIKIRLLPE